MLSDLHAATVASVPEAPLSRYEQRKLAGDCTRCGCALSDERTQAGESMCEPCHGYMLAAKRRSAKRRRAAWKRKRLCGECGKKRRPGGKLCPACSVRKGALATMFREHSVEHGRDQPTAAWDGRLEQSPDGKLRARRRFHGQGKRGRQSIEQLDEQDIADARACIEDGWKGLAYHRSDEVQALPRIQRDDVKREAIAKLRRGQRWLDEVIERNSPKSRKEQAVAEDE